MGRARAVIRPDIPERSDRSDSNAKSSNNALGAAIGRQGLRLRYTILELMARHGLQLYFPGPSLLTSLPQGCGLARMRRATSGGEPVRTFL
jgi:hypothetical protein